MEDDESDLSYDCSVRHVCVCDVEEGKKGVIGRLRTQIHMEK